MDESSSSASSLLQDASEAVTGAMKIDEMSENIHSDTPAPSSMSSNDIILNSGIPIARIKKLIKQDADVSNVSAEAVLMATAAAEKFCEYLSVCAVSQAAREKRKTLLYRDVAKAVNLEPRISCFLSEIIPEMITLSQALDNQNVQESSKRESQATLPSIDSFATQPLPSINHLTNNMMSCDHVE